MLKQRLKGGTFRQAHPSFFKTDSTNAVALGWSRGASRKARWYSRKNRRPDAGAQDARGFSDGRRDLRHLLLRRSWRRCRPVLTMMAGLSGRTAIEAVTGLNVDLKWRMISDSREKGRRNSDGDACGAEPARFVIVGLG